MKTISLLLILASGLIWPAVVHEVQHIGGKTVLYKTPGPIIKPQVVQWDI